MTTWYCEDYSSHSLALLASQAGFTGFYPLPPSLEQPSLYALLIAVMAHNAMSYPDITSTVKEWRSSLSEISQVLGRYKGYVNTVDERFWGEAYPAMLKFAVNYLQTSRLSRRELLSKLLQKTQLSPEEGQELVLILSRPLQLRTVILSAEGEEGRMKEEAGAEKVLFWTVLGWERAGGWYCFVDRNFRKGREGPRFPFYSESMMETVSFKGFNGGRGGSRPFPSQPTQDTTSLLSSALHLLLALSNGEVPSSASTAYSQFQSELQPLRGYIDAGLAQALESLKIRPVALPPHAITDCEQVKGELFPLDCGHKFHQECLLPADKRQVSEIRAKIDCPKCDKERSPRKPAAVDQKGQIEVPLGGKKTSPFQTTAKCNNCQLSLKISSLSTHESHRICYKCLQNVSTCPYCHTSLDDLTITWAKQTAINNPN